MIVWVVSHSFLPSIILDAPRLTMYDTEVVSGNRHKGFVKLITNCIENIRGHVDHLHLLRQVKQRGNPEAGFMERNANSIIRNLNARKTNLVTVMNEEVDMTDNRARADWLDRKKAVLRDIMGPMVLSLGEFEQHRCDEEVRKLRSDWVARWETYARMPAEKLVAAGWIKEAEHERMMGN